MAYLIIALVALVGGVYTLSYLRRVWRAKKRAAGIMLCALQLLSIVLPFVIKQYYY